MSCMPSIPSMSGLESRHDHRSTSGLGIDWPIYRNDLELNGYPEAERGPLMATYTYRCPECRGFVQAKDGRLVRHIRVRMSHNRLQRSECVGSGLVLT